MIQVGAAGLDLDQHVLEHRGAQRLPGAIENSILATVDIDLEVRGPWQVEEAHGVIQRNGREIKTRPPGTFPGVRRLAGNGRSEHE